MKKTEFVDIITSTLNKSRIPYMISGSICSSFHGQPRMTNDMDIIIDPTEKQLLEFLSSLNPSEYYFNKNSAIQAFKQRSMFNIIHMKQSWKADLIMRKDREYSRLEFSRRQNTTLMGTQVSMASPEDSILSKLEWAKNSGSQKQLDDVRLVLKVQKKLLDYDYLNEWAKKLGIYETLQKLLDETK